MFFRVLNEADAQNFHSLRLNSLKECPLAFSSSFEEESKRTVEEVIHNFNNVYSSHNNFILGAFNDSNQLIGIAGYFQETRPKTNHKGTIWGVYVIPQERNKGLARRLVSQILSMTKLFLDIEQINITVTSNNTAARNLYLSMGFIIYGNEPNSIKYNGQYADHELMALFLK